MLCIFPKICDKKTKICDFNQCFISVKNAMVDSPGNILTFQNTSLI